MSDSFQQIGIVGAGAMGLGIAQVCAQVGYRVYLVDTCPESLAQALPRLTESLQKAVDKNKLSPEQMRTALAGLSTHAALPELAACQLVIEAVPEDLALKQAVFQMLDALCEPTTILVSNTSSLSITALGGSTGRPTQVAGLHFFNPVPVMPLVEVIRGERTGEDTMSALARFVESLGKTPVLVRDTPGFIVNRVARPFYGESLKILGEQGGSREVVITIDRVMKEAGGFKMGPFELMDFIGLDVNLAVSKSVWNAYFQLSRYRPHPIQQRMVDAGLLGRKTKEGFYTYDV